MQLKAQQTKREIVFTKAPFFTSRKKCIPIDKTGQEIAVALRIFQQESTLLISGSIFYLLHSTFR